MACLNELSLYCNDKKSAREISEQAIAMVNRLEQRYSRYLADSILSKINATAGRTGMSVDAETTALLDYAQTCYQQSNGLFDVTSGVLRNVWDFKSDKLPYQRDVEAVQ
ncbi:MAG: FAD:protein FMN transferase, partial [Gammaproteobacteria bacterium]|nr:FAD:protein FMN transferase [Gammaproteobacteria bacterium]